MCYADPPYPGCAKKHYGPDAQEVNHKVLIQGLEENFDGWALSTHSPGLKKILSFCPDGVRVLAWIKPMAAYFPGVMPLYAWEPVIVKQGRKNHDSGKLFYDYISVKPPIFTRGKHSGVHGEKPKEFCIWIFQAMGMESDDEFIDLFPGSGAVSKAWMQFKSQRKLVTL
jgi:hypothetical protein